MTSPDRTQSLQPAEQVDTANPAGVPSIWKSYLAPDEQLKHWALASKPPTIVQNVLFLAVATIAAVSVWLGLSVDRDFIAQNGNAAPTVAALTSGVVCFGGTALLGLLVTKKYLVGLTDRRVIALQVPLRFPRKSGVKGVIEYPLNNYPPVTISTGSRNIAIKIDDSPKSLVLRFGNSKMPNNRAQATAIASTLSGKQT